MKAAPGGAYPSLFVDCVPVSQFVCLSTRRQSKIPSVSIIMRFQFLSPSSRREERNEKMLHPLLLPPSAFHQILPDVQAGIVDKTSTGTGYKSI